MAFAHGERAVVLDTNIRRVLTRTLDGVALPSTHVRAAERDRAQQLVPRDRAASVLWNAAVMEFGALVCTARAPLCGQCPLRRCAWREAGHPENAPVRRGQQWAGSDRQVRGAIMGELRGSESGVDYQELKSRIQHDHPWATDSQLERALGGLIDDWLVEQDPALAGSERVYRLPH